MSTKPIIVFVDDEPHNLTVFEAALPEDYEVHVFDSPLKALDALTNLQPWVVASDQKMPGMVGVNFLEIVKKTHPGAKRVLITGYSEEELVVDSIRKAGVHDYIRKPWDVDDLAHRIGQMIETFLLEKSLNAKTAELEARNKDLEGLTKKLDTARIEELEMRKELQAWAPPFVLDALKDKTEKFPMKKSLALITFDIIDGSNKHELRHEGRDIRSIVIGKFWELVIKNGGWRESTAGDSIYGHFGLLPGVAKVSAAALAVATEFRVYLRGLSSLSGHEIECGIGLHFATEMEIFLHTVKIETSSGEVVQKAFDSSCRHVDLVHRLEKMVHGLPGSNIIMTKEFVDSLESKPAGLKELGSVVPKGQKEESFIFLKPSDLVSDELLTEFIKTLPNSVAQRAA